MGVVSFRGKEVRHFSVGKTKLADFTSVQAAIDAIEAAGDASATKPYLVEVLKGEYTNADGQMIFNGDGQTPISHVHVFGPGGPWGARLRLIDDGLGYIDGALQISPTDQVGNNAAATDLTFEGLAFVNENRGGSVMMVSRGGTTEGAVAVGGDNEGSFGLTGGVPPSAPRWDRVRIESCYILGNRQGLVIAGETETILGSSLPGRCWVNNCEIWSQHEGITPRGEVRLWLTNNRVFIRDGLMEFNSIWKCNGFHHNIEDGSGTRHAGAFVEARGNYFDLQCDAANQTGADAYVCGVLLGHDQQNSDQKLPIRQRWHDTTIKVRMGQATTAPKVAGFMFITEETGALERANLPDGHIVVNGFDVDVENDLTSGGPSQCAGVWLQCESGDATLRVLHGHIRSKCPQAGATGYGLYSVGAGSTIDLKHWSIVGDVDTEKFTSGSGTITEMTTEKIA